MDVNPPNSRRNNFDLIRLLAALQVAVLHAIEHLGLKLPFHDVSLAVLACFPGVPIFFIISGFLIASSYERQPLADYARNRALRIFPGLWVCLTITVALIWTAGYFAKVSPPAWGLAGWILCQATFVQFFNPEFLRGYGVGVVNGSLWTITVELQFYLLTPLLVVAFRRSSNVFLSILVALTAFNIAFLLFPESLPKKVVGVTFAPWLYMFMLGAALHFVWPRVRLIFEGKLIIWAAAYAVIVIAEVRYGIGASYNTILPPYVILLSGLVMAGAHTRPQLAHTLLRRNDISYGVYIYHMPIYNFALYKGLGWTWEAIAAALVCAGLSWILVERVALGAKRRRSVGPPVDAGLSAS